MSARTRKGSSHPQWPQQLQLLFVAADHECPPGHASALRELAALATRKVPSRGIFDPTTRGEQDLFAAIDGVAVRHLGMRRAKAAWHRVVRDARLEPAISERIEQAAQQVQGVSDTAYFYAGLAFGLTSAALYGSRS